MKADVEIPYHPFSAIFPMLEGVAFRDLVEDIRKNGLHYPISLFEGQILDGRNRYRACKAAQVAAQFRSVTPGDALKFVASANLHRRHLDADQRAWVAAQIVRIRSPDTANAHTLTPEVRKVIKEAAEEVQAPFVKTHFALKLSPYINENFGELIKEGKLSVETARKIDDIRRWLPPEKLKILEKSIVKSPDKAAVLIDRVGAEPKYQDIEERKEKKYRVWDGSWLCEYLVGSSQWGRSFGRISTSDYFEIEAGIVQKQAELNRDRKLLELIKNHAANTKGFRHHLIRDIMNDATAKRYIKQATAEAGITANWNDSRIDMEE